MEEESHVSEMNDQEYLEALENERTQSQSKINELQSTISNSNYSSGNDPTLIHFQLETEDILSKLEHFLKGDIVKTDEVGNKYYAKQRNAELRPLNEYGVSNIMQILQNYIHKGTKLSYYTEERIYEILADLGDELVDWVFCNYEKIGLDSEFKRTKYEMLVLNIVHIIESAYRESIGGRTRQVINATNINTSNQLGVPQTIQQPIKKQFSILDPKSW